MSTDPFGLPTQPGPPPTGRTVSPGILTTTVNSGSKWTCLRCGWEQPLSAVEGDAVALGSWAAAVAELHASTCPGPPNLPRVEIGPAAAPERPRTPGMVARGDIAHRRDLVAVVAAVALWLAVLDLVLIVLR